MTRIGLLAAAVAIAAWTAPAAGQPVSVRAGDHEGYGRIVFEFAQAQPFTSEPNANGVTLHFPGAGEIGSPAGRIRNVLAVTGGPAYADIATAPGTRIRVTRIDTRIAVDLLDPPSRHPAAVSTARPPSGNGLSRTRIPDAALPGESVPEPPAGPAQAAVPAPAPSPPPPSPAETVQRVPPAATPEPHPVPEPAAAPEPPPPSRPGPGAIALAAIPAPPDAEQGSRAPVLPFGAEAGAAAFRHGAEGWIVFDERRPLEAASLSGDLLLRGATVLPLPAGTLLRVQVPPGRDLRLQRRPQGWSVDLAERGTPGAAVMPLNRPPGLFLPEPAPGEVVVVPGPDSGGNLLVGTLRQGGAGVPVAVRTPEFAVWSSWQGVVVEPVSDRTTLRTVKEGFALQTGAALSARPDGVALPGAAALTRRYDFAAQPVSTLLRRLQLQVEEQGRAAPQARLAPRKQAAQTMLSLGLGAEAQSLLRLAVAEDPRAATDADVAGLQAIAALLGGRPQEAAALDSQALSGSDEVTLWRAARTATLQPGSPAAAAAFASTAGLVLGYPAALRTRLLPLAAETMVEGGAPQTADALLGALPDEPLLAMARAMRIEQKGDVAGALVLYDALAAGRDRLASTQAATRATFLRLRTGALAPAEAAAALERGFPGWRGDERERDLRLRTASVQVQAGQWRKALETLSDTAQLFPADGDAISARMSALLTELLRGDGGRAMPPLDFLGIAGDYANLIGKADGSGLSNLLADKLAALDLPQRAVPVLERLVAASPGGAGRAALGARLAALRLDGGDAAAAAAVLASTDAPNLPAALAEERGMLDARIRAERHDVAGATAVLAQLDTPAAAELRAAVLGRAGDWHGAGLALAALVEKTVPASGPLDDGQQALLLRLASAQSRADDAAALRSLGVRESARMTGPRGDMFRLLTAMPVSGVGDLRRAGADVALAKALPSSFNALGR